MTSSPLGLVFSLGALFLWSLSPFFFTATGRRIGPFATNLMRVLLALPFLAMACALEFLWNAPQLPGVEAWILLVLSGAVGLAIGDQFLYSAFFHAGPERTSLVFTLSPVVTAILAWLFIRENLGAGQWMGMALVLGGVLVVTWSKQTKATQGSLWKGTRDGILAGLCQAGGSLLAHQAFLAQPALSPVLATTVRVGSAAAMLAVVALFGGHLGSVLRGARDPYVARRLLAGTLAGPVGGMLCFVAALKYQPAAIVTTITFMTPLLIIPAGAWWYGTRLTWRTVAGGAVALLGVALLGKTP